MRQQRCVGIMDPAKYADIGAQSRRRGDLRLDRPQPVVSPTHRGHESVQTEGANEARGSTLNGRPQIGVCAKRGNLARGDAAEPPRPILRISQIVSRAGEGLGEMLLLPGDLSSKI